MVELVPELWGQGSQRKSFAMLEPGTELVVREIQLRSGTGGRLHSHTLTMWFQVPMLPTRSGHMLMLDIPRRVDDTASYDVPEDEQRTGQLFIWKSGTVAPEGCQDPHVLSRRQRETYAAALHENEPNVIKRSGLLAVQVSMRYCFESGPQTL